MWLVWSRGGFGTKLIHLMMEYVVIRRSDVDLMGIGEEKKKRKKDEAELQNCRIKRSRRRRRRRKVEDQERDSVLCLIYHLRTV